MILGHEVRGAGPQKCLVLHDWQGDHRNYDLALPFFDTHAFTWAFADLRGYGWSRGIGGEHTAAEAAADVLALADVLDWQRFHVLGHSMTGMVVQRIALDARARVASCVAANPVPACGMQMPAEAYELFAASISDDEAYRALLAAIGGGVLNRRWADYKLEITRASAAPAVRRDYLDMFNSTDFAAAAQGLDTPMLVLLGELDHEGLRREPMQATFGRWYPNAELDVLAAVGHYPMQEKPAAFCALVESFLRRHAD